MLGQLATRMGTSSPAAFGLLRAEGYENRVIAKRLECGLQTVERKLAQIRDRFRQEDSS